MNKRMIAVALIPVAAAGLWFGYLSPTAKAKALVSAQLIDPDSAKFRNVREHGAIVCGEVNGKNRMGAYVGFKPFVALPFMKSSAGVVIANDDISQKYYDESCM